MRRKFASYHQPVSAVLPLVRGQLHNIAVGHSAHVSKAGHIAAAPYPLMGEYTAVWLSWLDDVQLMALDDTEPNYRRIQHDGEACPLVADHGDRPEGFSLFTSRWGVLADGDGGRLPFLDQAALFGLLAGSGTGDLLEEGKSVFGGPLELVAEQLAMPAVQAWAREWFSSAGLAAPVDFDVLRGGATPLVVAFTGRRCSRRCAAQRIRHRGPRPPRWTSRAPSATAIRRRTSPGVP